MSFAKISVLVVMAIMTSCVPNKAQTGVVGGAAGGALLGQMIGRDTKGTVLGATIGGLLGYIVGNEMDKSDQARLVDTYEYTPDRQRSEWVNPNTRSRYEVTPTRTYRERSSGNDCREAEVLATIDGKVEKTYTTACRENGQWMMK